MSGWFAGIPMRPVRPLDEATKRTVERVRRAFGVDWSRSEGEMKKPAIGDSVLVRIGGTDQAPTLRPGIVTNAFGGQVCNVRIFLDHANDDESRVPIKGPLMRIDQLNAHGYSIEEGSCVGQWRWPEPS